MIRIAGTRLRICVIDLLVWQSELVQAAGRGRTTMVQAARLRHEVGAKAGRPPGRFAETARFTLELCGSPSASTSRSARLTEYPGPAWRHSALRLFSGRAG